MAFPLRDISKNIKRALSLIKIINFNPKKSIGPLSIQIGLTSGCNYKCYFCHTHSYHKKDRYPTYQLADDVIDKLIEDIKLLKIKELVFAGNGEQFLHPRLLEMIEKCKQCRINLVTNGSMLDMVTPEIFANIAKITLSLNTINSDLHSIIHGYKSDSKLPNIMRNIERFISLPSGASKLQMNYCLAKNNFNELEEVFRLSSRWNVFFAIRPTEAVLPELKPEVLTPDQVHRARDTIKKMLTDASMSPRAVISLKTALHHFRSDKPYCKRTQLLPCYAGFYMPFIISTGDYNVCCYCEEPLGNINKQRLSEIWKSKSVQEVIYSAALMHENNKPVCSSCFICEDAEMQSKLFHRLLSLIPFQSRLLKHRSKIQVS